MNHEVSIQTQAVGLSLFLLLLCSMVFVPSPVEARGWYVRICLNRTEARSINFWLGKGEDEGKQNLHFWREWKNFQEPEFDLPDKYSSLPAIWIRAEAVPQNRYVSICLLYDGKQVKRLYFDKKTDYVKRQSERDKCDCM